MLLRTKSNMTHLDILHHCSPFTHATTPFVDLRSKQVTQTDDTRESYGGKVTSKWLALCTLSAVTFDLSTLKDIVPNKRGIQTLNKLKDGLPFSSYRRPGPKQSIRYVNVVPRSTMNTNGKLRWLDIRQILFSFFCLFVDRGGFQVHKLAKKITRPMPSHLKRKSLVNKGFIIWLSGNVFLRDTPGGP